MTVLTEPRPLAVLAEGPHALVAQLGIEMLSVPGGRFMRAVTATTRVSQASH